MGDILNSHHYFPTMTRATAEKCLETCPPGAFVIRPSSQPECLALSHRRDEGVGHALIFSTPVGFMLERTQTYFATVMGLLQSQPLRFDGERVLLAGQDVADALREEQIGSLASRISALPAVRGALQALQLGFRRLPGLVADGRDMGTVIFPGATLKVFLTASASTRAERRYKQLISKGIPANISTLRADLEAHDARDQNRSVAPLKPARDALLLDNSALTVEASMEQVLEAWEQRRPFG